MRLRKTAYLFFFVLFLFAGFYAGKDAFLLLFNAFCVFTDFKYKKIFNCLTFPASAAGLILGTINGGSAGFVLNFTGALAGGAALLPFYLTGGMGAGDVKLCFAIGAAAGISELPELLGAGALAGGIAAFTVLLVKGRLLFCLKRGLNFVFALIMPGFKPVCPSGPDDILLPYGGIICLGCITEILI
ncbi:MAG: prepilin peptidase [Fibrobacterota bacterium]